MTTFQTMIRLKQVSLKESQIWTVDARWNTSGRYNVVTKTLYKNMMNEHSPCECDGPKICKFIQWCLPNNQAILLGIQ